MILRDHRHVDRSAQVFTVTRNTEDYRVKENRESSANRHVSSFVFDFIIINQHNSQSNQSRLLLLSVVL